MRHFAPKLYPIGPNFFRLPRPENPLLLYGLPPYFHPQKMQRVLFLFLLLLAACTESQHIPLSNSSFEGTPTAGSPPDGWINCGDRSESL